MAGILELGLSGVYESKAPVPDNHPLADPPLPVGSFLAGSYGSHRLVGGDVWFSPFNLVQVSGHSSYNTETSRFSEHSYLAQVQPLKILALSASYDQHRDRDYFYSSVLFSDMLKSLGQESRVIGGSATATLGKVEVSADVKDYKRDIGEAQRFGADLRGNFFENTMRSGFGYHYLRASSNFAIVPVENATGSFHELRGWAMHDTKSYFASLDLIGFIFRKDVDTRTINWETQGTLGYHLTPDLALSCDLSYGQNSQYKEEFKGLMRLTYNMTSGKGATK